MARLVGKCSSCRKGMALEGAPVFRTWTVEGRGLAIGKTFEQRGWFLNALPVTHSSRKVRGVEAEEWLASVLCGCGGYAHLQSVRASVTAHQCGAKCLASKGPSCECACGGENHGRNYLLA